MSERPLELQKLYDFILPKAPIESLLDVGCHYTDNYYAPTLRQACKRYDGIDILPVGPEKDILDHRIVGNYLSNNSLAKEYEYVISISTIEHADISTYKTDQPHIERELMVYKMFRMATKGIFLTFPFGKGKLEDDYECIDFSELVVWSSIVGHFTFGAYYCADPNRCLGLDPTWYQIPVNEAKDKEYRKEIGTQCVGVLQQVF